MDKGAAKAERGTPAPRGVGTGRKGWDGKRKGGDINGGKKRK